MEKLSDPQDVKEWYVSFSAESLKDEESDHEELTSSLLVIASVSNFEFRDKNISKYTIGGGSRGAPGARAPPASLKWG